MKTSSSEEQGWRVTGESLPTENPSSCSCVLLQAGAQSKAFRSSTVIVGSKEGCDEWELPLNFMILWFQVFSSSFIWRSTWDQRSCFRRPGFTNPMLFRKIWSGASQKLGKQCSWVWAWTAVQLSTLFGRCFRQGDIYVCVSLHTLLWDLNSNFRVTTMFHILGKCS